jgi:hypothetical protein
VHGEILCGMGTRWVVLCCRLLLCKEQKLGHGFAVVIVIAYMSQRPAVYEYMFMPICMFLASHVWPISTKLLHCMGLEWSEGARERIGCATELRQILHWWG